MVLVARAAVAVAAVGAAVAVVVAVAAAAVWDELQESPGLQEDVEAWDAVSVHAVVRNGGGRGDVGANVKISSRSPNLESFHYQGSKRSPAATR